MSSQFSNYNLFLLNTWIGLCRGVVGLPREIHSLGYREQWIELRFQNSEDRTVRPEVILSSSLQYHTLLLEWKEGPNTDDDQLERYSFVTTQDLIQRVFIPPDDATNHDVCIIGLAEHEDRLRIGIRNGGYSFPLLLIEKDGFSLSMNQFTASEVTKVFTPKLVIDFNKAPTQIVPFDHNSEPWEIAERIMPKVIEYMFKRIPIFLLEQLANDRMPLWNIMDPGYKGDLRRKIQCILEDAERHEFQGYFSRNRSVESRTHSPTWQILHQPSSMKFDKRSREYRKLITRHRRFINALRTGKRQPLQLALEM